MPISNFKTAISNFGHRMQHSISAAFAAPEAPKPLSEPAKKLAVKIRAKRIAARLQSNRM